jgi:hypothetical protein
VLEPDEGKLSSPVLRRLGASNGARPLGRVHNERSESLYALWLSGQANDDGIRR